jgi:tetratricopeptide (TPR) repeat protein
LDEEVYLRGVRLAALTDSQLQIARGNIDLAIARLERFTELVDDDAMGFYLLAEAYRRKDMDGMFAQRTAAYQRTVDLDPNIPQAHRELGLALRQQKQFAEAEAALRQYLIVAPDAADGPIVEWYLDNLTAAAGDSQ